MTKKVSYQQIFTFINAANGYFKAKDGKTKLCYAIEKMEGTLKDASVNWQKVIKDLKIDFASVDEKDNLISTVNDKGENEYAYTKTNQKALDSAMEVAFSKQDVEVEVYYSPSTEAEKEIKELHSSYVDVFTPFIIEDKK